MQCGNFTMGTTNPQVLTVLDFFKEQYSVGTSQREPQAHRSYIIVFSDFFFKILLTEQQSQNRARGAKNQIKWRGRKNCPRNSILNSVQKKVKRCTLFGVSGDRFIIAFRRYCCCRCRVDRSFCGRVSSGCVLLVLCLVLDCVRLDCKNNVNVDERAILSWQAPGAKICMGSPNEFAIYKSLIVINCTATLLL